MPRFAKCLVYTVDEIYCLLMADALKRADLGQGITTSVIGGDDSDVVVEVKNDSET